MFTVSERNLVVSALEDKYKAVLRAQRVGRYPEMAAVFDVMLRDIRAVTEKVRVSKEK